MPKTPNDLPSCIQARNDLPFLVKNLCGGSDMQATAGECHPADIPALRAPITIYYLGIHPSPGLLVCRSSIDS